jgi:adenylate cyclase
MAGDQKDNSQAVPPIFERLLRERSSQPTPVNETRRRSDEVITQLEAALAADAQAHGYSLDYQNLWRAEAQHHRAVLDSIVPTHIGTRIQRGESLIADGYADVSVLFIDIVNFTHLSSDLTPRGIIELLDGVFTALDQLCEEFALEKIKTIGDAYMAAGGLEPQVADSPGDHTQRVLSMAQAALKFAAQHPAVLDSPFQIRVGIATGPVVAGVIGRKKITYDLWGDTVNIAARMCSEAAPMGIAVDELTFLSIPELADKTQVDRVDIKGKGAMQVYRLVV